MTSAGPWERHLDGKKPPKWRLKWGCVTSPEDVAGDRDDGLSALATTRAGYAGPGQTDYTQAVPAPHNWLAMRRTAPVREPHAKSAETENVHAVRGVYRKTGFVPEWTRWVISYLKRWYILVHNPPKGLEAVNTLRKGRFRSACTSRSFERYILCHCRDGASGT